MKHGHSSLIGALVVIALALIAAGGQGSLAAESPIYVDIDATGANNGTSWTDAYTDLQSALTAAEAGDEVWVAEGTYKPSVQYGGAGDRHKSFQLKNGVELYGGFDPTVGDVGLEDRDWVTNATILSGDIGTAGNSTDNSYHVFYHPSGTNLDTTAILDGFTVTGGNADGGSWQFNHGGGMFNEGSAPALSNCTFSDNSASYGGGMANYNSSSPLLANCTFRDNSADYGGGMWNWSSSSPTLTDCTFQGNSAVYAGGMWNWSSSPTLTHCTFSGNSAVVHGDGGAMYNDNGSSPTLADCTFAGNSADRQGGGMFNDGSSPTLTNCSFSGNSADYGGGMFNRDASSPVLTNCTFSGNSAVADGCGGMYNFGSSPVLTNCILWGDTSPEIYNSLSSPVVTHSDIQGGHPGETNIDADPRFVDPDNGDFHLGACSPCIDTGNSLASNLPLEDFEGDARILDGDGDGTAIVDMGVDEVVAGVSCFSHLYLPVVLKNL